MKKLNVLSVLVAMLFAWSGAFASYVDHLQTQSAEWAGNPTRTAATDSLDAIFYNPAGTVLMDNGLRGNIAVQVIAFPNEVEVEDATYPGQKKYKSSTPPSYVPNAYMSYKKDDFSVFGGFNIIGGGGSLYWSNGLPNINLAVQGVNNKTGIGWDNGCDYWSEPASGNVSIQQTSQIPGLTVGGAYKVNNMVSVSLGARGVYALESMKIKINSSGIQTNGDYTAWDGKWTGTGYCGIIGVDVKPAENITLAATFESLTRLEREIEVDTDNSKYDALSKVMGYTDGKKYRFDLPAKLSTGVEYAVIPTLKLSLSGILYFTQYGTYEKPNATGTESYDFDMPYEIGVGFDWQFIKNISWTAGVNYSCMNLTDEQMSEGGLIKNDLVDLGTGLKVRTDQGFDLAVGIMQNIYTEKENDATKGASGKTYKTKYKESATNVAISVEYKFF